MPNYTDNVGLRLITRPDEDNENFNTQTMLNDNWDKIDDAIGDLPGTLAEMGLSQYGSVADAVNKLADFGNWWFWEKWQWYPAGYDEGEVPAYTAIESVQDQSKSIFGVFNLNDGTIVLDAGTGFTANDDGTIDINNSERITLTTTGSSPWYNLSTLETIKGKYVRVYSITDRCVSCIKKDSNKVWYVDESTTFTTNSLLVNGTRAKAVLNDIPVKVYTAYSSIEKIKSYNSVGVAANPQEDKYPVRGKQGDYWYEKVGRILPQVETGSYVGTGTYGIDNPTEVHFSIRPKLFILYGEKLSTSRNGVDIIFGTTYTYNLVIPISRLTDVYQSGTGPWNSSTYVNYSYAKITTDGNGSTLSWYASSGNASAQLNDASIEYYWVAFG